MIIDSIKLTNFRNHSSYSLKCEDDTTLILGANGSGKTSVLEAIYILTRGKSFRSTDPEILKRGTPFYRIELNYKNGDSIAATYDGKTKFFLLPDKKAKRLPKKNKYPVILFLPSDLNLISHSPSRRRDYFDRIFSTLSDTYSDSLSKYEKSLKQRNELLKSDHISRETLFSWNILLSKYGTDLYNSRQLFSSIINQRIGDTYHSIAKNQDSINIAYESELQGITENSYLTKLESNYDKDLYLGHTTFGPHRDDFKFFFNHKLADGSASRGETRSIILALKFIEANLITEQLNLKPIILLDDVFSELDDSRRDCLVENFKNNQVIITSVKK